MNVAMVSFDPPWPLSTDLNKRQADKSKPADDIEHRGREGQLVEPRGHLLKLFAIEKVKINQS